MKKISLCLLVIALWVGTAYAVPAPVHSVSVNLPATVTVNEIFRLSVSPTEINFGAVDILNTASVNTTVKADTNCGRHISLQVKGTDFVNQPNVIDISAVKMENTLICGEGQVTTPLTMSEDYQTFAKSTGNPNKYLWLGINSRYTITVPAVVAGTYTSVFTVTMSE